MKIIDGGLAVDDRGTVTFVNDFDFRDVGRFYMVENHAKGFVRAWHGHKKEAKYVLVVSGAALIRTVPFDGDKVEACVLSAHKPQVLYIPPKHYNGFKTFTDDTRVIFFSTSTLEESKNDDVRLKWDYFDKWDVEPR